MLIATYVYRVSCLRFFNPTDAASHGLLINVKRSNSEIRIIKWIPLSEVCQIGRIDRERIL